jgi:hypothetical protein
MQFDRNLQWTAPTKTPFPYRVPIMDHPSKSRLVGYKPLEPVKRVAFVLIKQKSVKKPTSDVRLEKTYTRTRNGDPQRDTDGDTLFGIFRSRGTE